MTNSAESTASSSLTGLVQEIQNILERDKTMGLVLENSINLIDRKHLQVEFESMKLRTKDKRSVFFDDMRKLLADAANEWFAFFRVHS